MWPDTADNAGPTLEDMVSITISEGPRKRHIKEMDTLPMIWGAWIARRDLDVSIRNMNQLA